MQLRRGGNIREHGRSVEIGAEIGHRVSAGEHRGTGAAGLFDMLGDRLELLRPRQGAHVRAVVELRAETVGAGRLGEMGAEGLIEVFVDVDALDRDAQLPGRGERSAHGALDGLLQIRIGGHDQRVLAPELERGREQTLPRLGGDRPSRGRRPGERDSVGTGHECGADLGGRAGHELPHLGGQTRGDGQPAHEHRGQRRRRIGFVDDGVAGGQGREQVGRTQGQRVVPRCDEPDHAQRGARDLGAGEHGDRPAPTFGTQIPGGHHPVVAEHIEGIEDLVIGVDAGLAGLVLDDVEEQILIPDQCGMQSSEHLRPVLNRLSGPCFACDAGRGVGGLDVVGSVPGEPVDLLAGERFDAAHHLARTGGIGVRIGVEEVPQCRGDMRGRGLCSACFGGAGGGLCSHRLPNHVT